MKLSKGDSILDYMESHKKGKNILLSCILLSHNGIPKEKGK